MASTGTQTGRPIEIRALTGLRIVAAALVMVKHLSWSLDGPFRPYLAPLWPIIRAGWVGVDLFFILSGFVITWTYLDKLGPKFSLGRTADFVWARFARVWPVWALLTILFATWLFVSRADAGTGMNRPVTLRTVLEQLLMVQMWDRDVPANSSFVHPGWSISAEWLAYVCFPVAVLVLYRLRNLPSAVLALAAVGAVTPTALVAFQTGSEPFWLLRITGGFAAGALMAMAVRRTRRTPIVERLAAIMSILCLLEVVAICWWANWRSNGDINLDYSGVAVVVFPFLVGSLALTDRGPASWLSRDTLVVGGRISYCLYLVHTIVFELFEWAAQRLPLLSPENGVYVLVLPQLFLVSLALSWVLHTRVEEPARIWLRDRGPSRWTSRRAATVPVPAHSPAPAPSRTAVPSPVLLQADAPVRPRPRAAVTASLSAASVVRPRTAPHPGHRPGPASAADESPFEPSVHA